MKMAWVQKGFLAARWDGRLQSFSSSDGWCEPKLVQTCWLSRLSSIEKDKTGGSSTGRLKTGGSKVVFAICLRGNIQGFSDPSFLLGMERWWRFHAFLASLVSVHMSTTILTATWVWCIPPCRQVKMTTFFSGDRCFLGMVGPSKWGEILGEMLVVSLLGNAQMKWQWGYLLGFSRIPLSCQHVRNWLNVSFVSRFPGVGVSRFLSLLGPRVQVVFTNNCRPNFEFA